MPYLEGDPELRIRASASSQSGSELRASQSTSESLVAPIEQLWHHRAVRAAPHEAQHGGGVAPERARPEHPRAQHAHVRGEAAVVGKCLPPRAECAEHERRQKVQPAQA